MLNFWRKMFNLQTGFYPLISNYIYWYLPLSSSSRPRDKSRNVSRGDGKSRLENYLLFKKSYVRQILVAGKLLKNLHSESYLTSAERYQRQRRLKQTITFTSQTHSPTKKQKGEKRDFFHLSPHEGKTHNLAEHVETRSRLGAELGERLL